MKNDTSAVYEAQGYLRKAASLYRDMKEIVPDGIYGEETEQAVRDFQRLTGLPVTGRINLDTWNMLVKKAREVDEAQEKPEQVAPITNADLPLREGDRGDLVLTAQQMLRRIAERYSNMPEISADGIYGPETARAVSRWQHTCRIPQTGEIDKTTWNRLAQYYTMPTEVTRRSGEGE